MIFHAEAHRDTRVDDHAEPAAAEPWRTRPGGVLVIGVGNDLRGDDGAGRAVVEELERLAVPGVEAVWSHQLVPELAERISRAAMVVFVDAALPGSPGVDDAAHPDVPGVEVRPVTASAPAVGGHQADPAALLGLAALAGLHVPPAYVVTVAAHDLGLGTRLSDATRAAVTTAVAEVLGLAARHARTTSAGRRVDGAGA